LRSMAAEKIWGKRFQIGEKKTARKLIQDKVFTHTNGHGLPEGDFHSTLKKRSVEKKSR